MAFHSLALLPDGRVYDDRVVSNADLSASDMHTLAHLLETSPSHSKLEIDTAIGSLQLETTRGESGALLTARHKAGILISSVLLSGQQPEADSELLSMYCASLARTRVVQELTSQHSPFSAFQEVTRRPFLGTVFWPVIPYEQLRQVVSVDLSFAAVFFGSLGV